MFSECDLYNLPASSTSNCLPDSRNALIKRQPHNKQCLSLICSKITQAKANLLDYPSIVSSQDLAHVVYLLR